MDFFQNTYILFRILKKLYFFANHFLEIHVDSCQKRKPMTHKRILLAFSGGLDTSAIIPWLKETYDAEIIAYCSDLGNAPDPEALEKHAKSLGASELIFEDIRLPFVRDFVYPIIRASAIYQDEYLLGTAIARPIIAERMAHWAKEKGVTAIAHGATGKGNDQIRFERSWAFLVPDVEMIAPWKIWDFKGRQDLLQYLNSKGIAFQAEEKKYSIDTNLYHRSCEGGILEKVEQPYATKEIYNWIRDASEVTEEVSELTLDFEKGFATRLNGEALSPEVMLAKLNEIGGQHGIGVVDLLESRTNGIKSRGIYETPGGTLLYKATQTLKHMCWDKSLLSLGRHMSQTYAEKVYEGLWHARSRYALEAFFAEASEVLTGTIKMKIQNATIIFTARQSEFSLYDEDLVSFERDPHGLNEASDGYCRTLKLSNWQEGRQRKKAQ